MISRLNNCGKRVLAPFWRMKGSQLSGATELETFIMPPRLACFVVSMGLVTRLLAVPWLFEAGLPPHEVKRAAAPTAHAPVASARLRVSWRLMTSGHQ